MPLSQAKLAEAQEKKVLKKLTPEQRAKYMGDVQTKIPSIQEIAGEIGEETEETKEEAEGKQPEKQPEPAKKEKKEVNLCREICINMHNIGQFCYTFFIICIIRLRNQNDTPFFFFLTYFWQKVDPWQKMTSIIIKKKERKHYQVATKRTDVPHKDIRIMFKIINN